MTLLLNQMCTCSRRDRLKRFLIILELEQTEGGRHDILPTDLNSLYSDSQMKRRKKIRRVAQGQIITQCVGGYWKKMFLMCTGCVADMSFYLNRVFVCVTREEPAARRTSFLHNGEITRSHSS